MKKKAIAIIGMSCRAPGVENLECLASVLDQGKVTVGADSSGAEAGAAAQNHFWTGRAPHLDAFDFDFFGVSPREASSMDPQQRLALELVWEALQDGGIPAQTPGTTGVFVGSNSDDFAVGSPQKFSSGDPGILTGLARSSIAGRVSHFFGWDGPSLVLDSDRSSSLTALHYAILSLRSGEVDRAVVGGTNYIATDRVNQAFASVGVLSGNGKTRFGDVHADGIIRSSGGGFVILKDFEAAKKDGDSIYSVILESAHSHNGGKSKDYTATSGDAHLKQYDKILTSRELTGTDIAYVEAHGTGTPLGDREELGGLSVLLKDHVDKGAMVGSVKANVGHLEAAAGILSLIKISLCLKNEMIPKVPNSSEMISAAGSAICIPQDPQPWKKGGEERYGLVNSFGLTGSLTTALVAGGEYKNGGQERPRPQSISSLFESSPSQILLVSARDAQGLEVQVTEKERLLSTLPRRNALALSYQGLARSVHGPYRALLEVSTNGEFNKESFLVEKAHLKNFTVPPKVCFVFPGQGGQWHGMGIEFYKKSPAFRTSVQASAEVLKSAADMDILPFYEQWNEKERENHLNNNLQATQTLLTVNGMALVDFLLSVGVKADCVLGTSMGEVAAAYCAGILSRRDALSIIFTRTQLMSQVSGQGAMAVVEMEKEELLALLGKETGGKVSLAVTTSPSQSVISGDLPVVTRLVEMAKERQLYAKLVKVNIASHSSQMDPILGDLKERLSHLKPKSTLTPFYSSVCSGKISGDRLKPSYWCRNLREPVLFVETAELAIAEGATVFLEISPHSVMSQGLTELVDERDEDIHVLSLLNKKENEISKLQRSLGQLTLWGVPVDWKSLVSFRGEIEKSESWSWNRQSVAIPVAGGSVQTPAEPVRGQEPSPVVKKSQREDNMDGKEPQWNRKTVEATVRAAVAGITGKSGKSLSRDANFKELGLSSINYVELRNLLKKKLPLKTLQVATLFSFASIGSLSAEMYKLLEQRIDIGDSLRSINAASEQEIQQATVVQKNSPQRKMLGELLLDQGQISQHQLERALRRQSKEPVAIVGVSMKLPQSNNFDELWSILCESVCTTGRFPQKRRELIGMGDSSLDEVFQWIRGCFIDDISSFDGNFFSISPRESERMDPQQRLALELSYLALQDANIPMRDLKGKAVGVFLGAMNYNEYQKVIERSASAPDRFDVMGNSLSIAAGRLSYFFDINGPAMTLDTACSSGLVALNNAVDAIRSGRCESAIVAGVNLLVGPEPFHGFSSNSMLSPDGRCWTFDDRANGYVRGEGGCALIVKPLSMARRDKDHIYGLVTGVAVNQDGYSSGITAPNGRAQEAVFKGALEDAGLVPDDITYVEAHGTGTKLGDPIEMESIKNVYGRPKDVLRNHPLWVGSVKANLGHLEPASGLAGLMKVLACLGKGKVTPQANFSYLNSHSEETRNHFRIPTALAEWNPGDRSVRAAAVSSFGFSGTNSHVIVEEYPLGDDENKGLQKSNFFSPYVFFVSGKSKKSLLANIESLYRWVCGDNQAFLNDVAFTLAVGRDHFKHRLGLSAATLKELKDKLQGALEDQVPQSSQKLKLNDEFSHGDQETPLHFRVDGEKFMALDFSIIFQMDSPFSFAVDRVQAFLKKNNIDFSLANAILNKETIEEPSMGENRNLLKFTIFYGLLSFFDDLGFGSFSVESEDEVFQAAVQAFENGSQLEHWVQGVVGASIGGLDKGLRPKGGDKVILDLAFPEESDEGTEPATAHFTMSPGGTKMKYGEDPMMVFILEMVRTLYSQGVDLNWTSIGRLIGGKKCKIPSYVFDKKESWVKMEETQDQAFKKAS